MTVNNPSKADASAIEAAKETAERDSFIKTAGQVADAAKAAAAKNPNQKSLLSKQDQQNIELINKNPKAVAQIETMLQDPAIQEAFCYSDNFRSTLLVKMAANNETQKDIKETKEALNNLNGANAKYDNEEQRQYFEEKKKIRNIENEALQAYERLKNVGSGLIFSGDRVCMTDSLVTLVGLGSNKLGKFGGVFKLLSGFLGQDRFSSYLALDFENKRNQDDNSAEAQATASAGQEAINRLAISGNGNGSRNA